MKNKFDVLADSLVAKFAPLEWYGDDHSEGSAPRCCVAKDIIAKALAETEASALESAAKVCDDHSAAHPSNLASHIRALNDDNIIGHKLVPLEPSYGQLMSMAIRSDHALGMPGYYDMLGSTSTDHAKRLHATITSMKQLYEEIVGTGFYSPQHEKYYMDLLNQHPPVPGIDEL